MDRYPIVEPNEGEFVTTLPDGEAHMLQRIQYDEGLKRAIYGPPVGPQEPAARYQGYLDALRAIKEVEDGF